MMGIGRCLGIGLLAGGALAITKPARAQQVYGEPSVPVAGKVLGTVIHTQDAEELRYVVLKHLTGPYAAEKGIVVTPAEKEAYVAHVQAALQQDRERREARHEELTRKLAAGHMSTEQRAALTAELDTLNTAIAALGETRRAAAADQDEIKAARDDVAAAFIRQWKINRALYQEYGGRIIFQQGGPEPLDAYRKFLEEHQARGDFAIMNKNLEAGFWRYYRDDAIHSFYPSGSPGEAQAFAAPPWASE